MKHETLNILKCVYAVPCSHSIYLQSVYIMLIGHRDYVMFDDKLHGIKNNEYGMRCHRLVMA
jgi:hypothetical protein